MAVPRESPAAKHNAEQLPDKITLIMEQQQKLIHLLLPLIQNYLENLENKAIHQLAAGKSQAIAHLSPEPKKDYLIAKAALMHRYREAVVHMETVYANLYRLFETELRAAVNIPIPQAADRHTKPTGQTVRAQQIATKKSMAILMQPHPQPKPAAHSKAPNQSAIVHKILQIVLTFTQRYNDASKATYENAFGHV